MLLQEWRKFKGWAVLEFFLYEGKKTYLKELSRTLKISPRTAQVYLQLYEKEGILESERTGNAIFYSLVANAITAELKKTYLLIRIFPYVREFVSENAQIGGIALYGSAARGEYDRSSDIDMLVISPSKQMKIESIGRLEKDLGMEVKLEIVSIGEWRRLAEKKDRFYSSVSSNNILLYGVLP